MAQHPTDWTIFWRQLSEVPAAAAEPGHVQLALLEPAFYRGALPDAVARGWLEWLRVWLVELRDRPAGVDGIASGLDGLAVGEAMRTASPKYVPREWMLVEAYTAAERGEYAPLRELHELLRRPYDEQPEHEAKHFARAPPEELERAGTAFMT